MEITFGKPDFLNYCNGTPCNLDKQKLLIVKEHSNFVLQDLLACIYKHYLDELLHEYSTKECSKESEYPTLPVITRLKQL